MSTTSTRDAKSNNGEVDRFIDEQKGWGFKWGLRDERGGPSCGCSAATALVMGVRLLLDEINGEKSLICVPKPMLISWKRT